MIGVGRLFYGQLLQGLPVSHQMIYGKVKSGFDTETLDVLHRVWQQIEYGNEIRQEQKRRPTLVAHI